MPKTDSIGSYIKCCILFILVVHTITWFLFERFYMLETEYIFIYNQLKISSKEILSEKRIV